MRNRFNTLLLLAILAIWIGIVFFTVGLWLDNEEVKHLKVSSAYYLALGVIYILAFKKCQYIYIYIYPMTFILQILCFIRLKYTIINSGGYGVGIFYEYSDFAIYVDAAGIINIIMLIGFIQYFDILRRITEIEKYEMGFKTWKN